MFKRSREIELDGRTLTVSYQGERFGYFARDHSVSIRDQKLPPHEATPAESIALCIGASVDNLPAFVHEFSDEFERDVQSAPRYECDCCGHRTLLNTGRFEICAVCFWEDDRIGDSRTEGDAAEVVSGPNHISLAQARKNFAEYGACDAHARAHARKPRPGE